MGTATDKPVQALQVACEMCRKQVPAAEAVVAEATGSFAYFCGLACCEQWKHRGGATIAEITELYG